MRVRRRVELLRLPRHAPREQGPVQVELPVLYAQGRGAEAWARAEERAEHDVCGRQRQHGQDTEGALTRASVRQRRPALPRPEYRALVPVTMRCDA